MTTLLLFLACFLDQQPQPQIIHVCNLHFVDATDFAKDLIDQDGTLTDEQIEKEYEKHHNDVEAFQEKQLKVLRELVRKTGATSVFHEGMTPDDVKPFVELAKQLKQYKPSPVDDGLSAFLDDLHRRDTLLLGNAARLLNSGEIKQVVAIEDSELLEADNPLKTGTFAIDEDARKKREDHMVQMMLKSGETVMILLCGKDHEFTDNIPAGVSYRRIEIPTTAPDAP
ncbi:MAG: hypothetical protein R3C12_18555 [Planctomycetaceae bacterium]